MFRLPPRSTRTDTLFPYTTLFRAAQLCLERVQIPSGKLRAAGELDRARIDGASVAVKLVMQVRAGRHAGRSDIADDLALLDPLPCRHLEPAHMRIGGDRKSTRLNSSH